MDRADLHRQASIARDEYTKAFLTAGARRIVVVAGPGTGKTTLFREILKKKGANTLTLSFINALVDELSLNLYQLSDVRTLHGFAVSVLSSTPHGARIHPKLTYVIREDAEVLLGDANVEFESFFHNCEGDAKYFEFYKRRKDLYGNYYGFADSVYALVKYFERYPNRIPTYDQILIDEFQDFNEAEVRLIKQLASNSPILIAGDDDQSLYMDLRDANPKHIRELHQSSSELAGYLSLPLPYCSRSTRVIVDAARDIVEGAQANGCLSGRVNKDYIYFPCEKKDTCSDLHPHIVYTQHYEDEMVHFISKHIQQLAAVEREPFDVLVVMPPKISKHALPKIARQLRHKGFKRVIAPSSAMDKTATLIDGLTLLMQDKDDKLGWRIVAPYFLNEAQLKDVLIGSEDGTEIKELLESPLRARIRKLVATLRKVVESKDTPDEELKDFIQEIGLDPYELAKEQLRDEIMDAPAFDATSIPRAVRKIPITLTTVPSSKGLAADYVFITHFDDTQYSSDGLVCDEHVYSLLVALTRARKKAFLISSKDQDPKLISWIKPERVERQMDSPHRLSAQPKRHAARKT